MKSKNYIACLVTGLIIYGCATPTTTTTTSADKSAKENPVSSNISSGGSSTGSTSSGTSTSGTANTGYPYGTATPQRPTNSSIPVGATAGTSDTSSSLYYPAPTNSSIPVGQTGATSDIRSNYPIPGLIPSPSASPVGITKDNFFANYGVNPFVDTTIDHFSTFAVDVDTASYTWMRKSFQNNLIPSKDSVRVEEYVNYFDYNYPQPEQTKFLINMDMAPSNFDEPNIKLLRIGLQGKEIKVQNRKDAILTFVIDVSGSMAQENRLGLVKQSLELLLKQLKQGDQVGIVVFGSNARIALEHQTIDNEGKILQVINQLQTEGSTNTEAGLTLGYKLAEKAFKAGAINRIILCSDGVANVGVTGPDAILAKIKQSSESGINLSTVGFGMGNYNDTLMEKLANSGDGYYAYVDTLKEAERIFVQNLTGTLQVIAKDAKVQVDFNPELVSEYRLIGYENRDIADNDFRNDAVDAGEIGSNHSVTALYKVKLKDNIQTGKVASVILRYKDIDNLNTILEVNKTIELSEQKSSFASSTPSFKLAAAVTEYAEVMRQSPFAKESKLQDILALVKEIKADLNSEKVNELFTLIEKAINLKNNQQ